MSEAFLGVPDVSPLLFAGLSAASFFTAFIGVVTGTAGGLLLLALMAMVFPPAILVPVHTLVQLGIGSSRIALMWAYVLKGTLLPFAVGAAIGAAAGAQIFVSLPTAALQGILGLFILLVIWTPHIGTAGTQRNRFGVLGFGATFLGMFVSATGTLVAPFVAHASPDRRNHAATVGALMTIVHIAKIVAFGVLGVGFGAHLPLVASMIMTGAMGNWAGRETLGVMRERNFRVVFQVIMTLLAIRLIWIAAGKMGWI